MMSRSALKIVSIFLLLSSLVEANSNDAASRRRTQTRNRGLGVGHGQTHTRGDNSKKSKGQGSGSSTSSAATPTASPTAATITGRIPDIAAHPTTPKPTTFWYYQPDAGNAQPEGGNDQSGSDSDSTEGRIDGTNGGESIGNGNGNGNSQLVIDINEGGPSLESPNDDDGNPFGGIVTTDDEDELAEAIDNLFDNTDGGDDEDEDESGGDGSDGEGTGEVGNEDSDNSGGADTDGNTGTVVVIGGGDGSESGTSGESGSTGADGSESESGADDNSSPGTGVIIGSGSVTGGEGEGDSGSTGADGSESGSSGEGDNSSSGTGVIIGSGSATGGEGEGDSGSAGADGSESGSSGEGDNSSSGTGVIIGSGSVTGGEGEGEGDSGSTGTDGSTGTESGSSGEGDSGSTGTDGSTGTESGSSGEGDSGSTGTDGSTGSETGTGVFIGSGSVTGGSTGTDGSTGSETGSSGESGSTGDEGSTGSGSNNVDGTNAGDSTGEGDNNSGGSIITDGSVTQGGLGFVPDASTAEFCPDISSDKEVLINWIYAVEFLPELSTEQKSQAVTIMELKLLSEVLECDCNQAALPGKRAVRHRQLFECGIAGLNYMPLDAKNEDVVCFFSNSTNGGVCETYFGRMEMYLQEDTDEKVATNQMLVKIRDTLQRSDFPATDGIVRVWYLEPELGDIDGIAGGVIPPVPADAAFSTGTMIAFAALGVSVFAAIVLGAFRMRRNETDVVTAFDQSTATGSDSKRTGTFSAMLPNSYKLDGIPESDSDADSRYNCSVIMSDGGFTADGESQVGDPSFKANFDNVLGVSKSDDDDADNALLFENTEDFSDHRKRNLVSSTEVGLGMRHSTVDVHQCTSAHCPICMYKPKDIDFIYKSPTTPDVSTGPSNFFPEDEANDEI